MSVLHLIRRRRSVYPKSYRLDQNIERAELETLLEAARWAPTHRMTEPWRFVVFHSAESRARLGEFLADYYRSHTPPEAFSEEKYRKAGENPGKAGAVLAIVLQRDPELRVPEFEEIAAVSMAVQNMWLLCADMGLGAYWSTPQAALESDRFLELEAGQRCLGLFYIGRHDMPEMPGKRSSMDDKVRWL